jgi:hypothetical protein
VEKRRKNGEKRRKRYCENGESGNGESVKMEKMGKRYYESGVCHLFEEEKRERD